MSTGFIEMSRENCSYKARWVLLTGVFCISGHHEAGHPEVGPARGRQAHLGADLRGNPGRPQGLPGERDQGRGDLHRACQEEDRDRDGRGLRPQEAGKDPLRIRRLIKLGLIFVFIHMKY